MTVSSSKLGESSNTDKPSAAERVEEWKRIRVIAGCLPLVIEIRDRICAGLDRAIELEEREADDMRRTCLKCGSNYHDRFGNCVAPKPSEKDCECGYRYQKGMVHICPLGIVGRCLAEYEAKEGKPDRYCCTLCQKSTPVSYPMCVKCYCEHAYKPAPKSAPEPPDDKWVEQANRGLGAANELWKRLHPKPSGEELSEEIKYKIEMFCRKTDPATFREILRDVIHLILAEVETRAEGRLKALEELHRGFLGEERRKG